MHFTTTMSVVRPFSVLSKDEIGPFVKRAVFLLRLNLGGGGLFPPFKKKTFSDAKQDRVRGGLRCAEGYRCVASNSLQLCVGICISRRRGRDLLTEVSGRGSKTKTNSPACPSSDGIGPQCINQVFQKC